MTRRIKTARDYQTEVKQLQTKEESSNEILGKIIVEKDLFQALTQIDKVLKIDPNNSLAFLNKARILEKLGETKEAIEFLKEAVRLAPENEEILKEKELLLQKIADTRKFSEFRIYG